MRAEVTRSAVASSTSSSKIWCVFYLKDKATSFVNVSIISQRHCGQIFSLKQHKIEVEIIFVWVSISKIGVLFQDEINEIPFFDSSLPRELALGIFRHLDACDLCACAQVSRRLRSPAPGTPPCLFQKPPNFRLPNGWGICSLQSTCKIRMCFSSQVSRAWRSLAEDAVLWLGLAHRYGFYRDSVTANHVDWKQRFRERRVRDRTVASNWKVLHTRTVPKVPDRGTHEYPTVLLIKKWSCWSQPAWSLGS